MSEINTAVLSLIDEAVLTVKGGRIEFANRAAQRLLGGKVQGRKLDSVLGSELAAVQATGYTAGINIKGRRCILRASKKAALTTIIIKEEEKNTDVINDAFISSVRSDLNMLSISAEHCRLLAEVQTDARLKETLATLTKSIYITARQITNLSCAKDILNDRLQYEPCYTDLTRLCSEIVSQACSMLDMDISIDAPEGLLCSVDRKLITRLMANLISNSCIHGRAEHIAIRLIDCERSIILAVNDDGRGIPAEKLGDVFERYRASYEIGELYSGAGLGLTVVRGIAALHGGSLMLESREANGTAVRVSLSKNTTSAVSMHCDSLELVDTGELLLGLCECIKDYRFGAEYMD